MIFLEEIDKISETDAIGILIRCNEKIRQLQSEIETQRACKDALEKRLFEIRSVNPPITRLPEELLLQIFKELSHRRSHAAHPILLVCRRWNLIARSCPGLWTSILLDLKPDAAAIHRQIHFTEVAVRYSGNAPLDIELHIPSKRDLWTQLVHNMLAPLQNQGAFHKSFVTWLSSLSRDGNRVQNSFEKDIDLAVHRQVSTIRGQGGQTMRRVRSLVLTFTTFEFWNWPDEPLFLNEAPILEELTILISGESDTHISDLLAPPAPKLSRLICNFIPPFYKLLPRDGQLTHLRLIYAISKSEQIFNNVLFTCNLKYLHVQLFGPSEESSLVLPVLEDLTIESHAPHAVDMIKAPKLHTLRLLNPPACQSFLNHEPPFPMLRKLHLWATFLDMEKVITYISKLPRLTELAFLETSRDEMEKCMKSVKNSQVMVKGYNVVKERLRASFSFDLYEYDEIATDLSS